MGLGISIGGLTDKMSGRSKPKDGYDRNKRYDELVDKGYAQDERGVPIRRAGTVLPSEAISIIDREEREWQGAERKEKRPDNEEHRQSQKQSGGFWEGVKGFGRDIAASTQNNMKEYSSGSGGYFGGNVLSAPTTQHQKKGKAPKNNDMYLPYGNPLGHGDITTVPKGAGFFNRDILGLPEKQEKHHHKKTKHHPKKQARQK